MTVELVPQAGEETRRVWKPPEARRGGQ